MSTANILCIAFLSLLALTQIQAVRYDVVDQTDYITGCNRFKTEIGTFYARQTMRAASSFIWLTFNESMNERKEFNHVIMLVRSFGQTRRNLVARTSNKNILINADYIQNYPGDVRVEFTGILLHEMTHVWQQYGNGKAPRGLINGIADYVRLKSGWAPKEWVKRGAGSRWDEGYAVTAYFLEYCEGLKTGFVAELNRLMRDDYSDEFFEILLEKTVDELWTSYKADAFKPVISMVAE